MSDNPSLQAPTAERRRIAAGKFERANQVAATNNFDYAIKLLIECCQLDPANLIYRKALRQTQRAKHGNNQRGSTLALLTTGPQKLRLQAARRSGDHLKALEHAEHILVKNPWDVGAQLALAETFDDLKLPDQAIWCLEMARQTTPDNKKVNRLLARLYERRGNFAQAIALWEWLRKKDPTDVEAAGKASEIAALSTIARGNYEQVIAGRQAAEATEREQEAGTGEAVNETDTHQAAGTAETQALLHPRIAREAAPLLARLKANQSNPNVYLQLAQLYRKAELPDEARKTLQQGLAPTGNAFELAAELAELDLEPFRKNLEIADAKLKRDPKNEEVRSSAPGWSRKSTRANYNCSSRRRSATQPNWVTASSWACGCCEPISSTRPSANCRRPARTHGIITGRCIIWASASRAATTGGWRSATSRKR